eukprot:TRINITY_DN24175_c0_g3_i1.p1 TRINITY_DN24175_c0_g3~~TRINITY_DN24175_c0_g3_i1.p1  ORF type:complete len:253 (-),score=46.83 TRINITY_DN24175_c0_g3_i1:167-925(-)
MFACCNQEPGGTAFGPDSSTADLEATQVASEPTLGQNKIVPDDAGVAPEGTSTVSDRREEISAVGETRQEDNKEDASNANGLLEITVNNEHGVPFGLEAMVNSLDRFVVQTIWAGPVQDHNLANERRQIKEHDWIMAVNDTRGDAKAIKSSLSTARQAKLSVARPTTLTVTLSGKPLGMELKTAGPSYPGMVISRIKPDTAVATYNSGLPPEKQVKPGDVILKVNGSKDALLDSLRKSDTYTITMEVLSWNI